MTLLSRDQILKADDTQTREVDVPEWGGTVRVKSLTGRERDAFEESTIQGQGKKVRQNMTNFRAKLVALSVVDEENHVIFSQKDVAFLGIKSAAALQRVFNVAAELSGMTEKDVEELTENLDDDPNESSTSD